MSPRDAPTALPFAFPRSIAEMPLTEDSRNGILAVFVLIGFVLLLIFVPHEWLRPAAIGGLVLGVLSVLGC